MSLDGYFGGSVLCQLYMFVASKERKHDGETEVTRGGSKESENKEKKNKKKQREEIAEVLSLRLTDNSWRR